MTLYRFATTLRRYGINGIIDWAARKCLSSKDPFLQSLEDSLAHDHTPVRGITVIGELSSQNSLSKVLSDLISSLSDAGIPHQVYDTTKPIPEDFVLNRFTDIITMFQDFRIKNLSPCRLHRIVFWEFDTGFIQAHPDCIDGTPLLAMSTYCLNILRHQVHRKTPVEYIRYPFHFTTPNIIDNRIIREKFNIPTNAFMVFFNFDYRSSYYRKNPEGLLAAFTEAFADVPHAFLVFKTNGSRQKKEIKDRLEHLVSHSSVASRVRFIDDFISVDELVSLTAACDVFASLHRGEGFGLGVAEAMSLGKPIVVSDCGATNEFCTQETSIKIPHKIVKTTAEQKDHPDYTWVNEWPEPDVYSAAIALKQLYDDPALRRRIGDTGRHFIEEHYSTAAFKKSIEKLLDDQPNIKTIK